MPVVDKRVGRHDLDRGDAELGQVLDRRWMSEPGEGPARGFGNRQVEPREAAQVELVDDQRLGRDALMSRLSRGRLSSNRLRRVRAGVLPKLEHRGMELERLVKPPGVRIGQQFGWVKTKSPLRIVGTLDAEAVSRARTQPGRDAAQNAIGVVRHWRADDLPIAIIDAQRRALGVGRHERRFEAARRDEDAASGFWVAHAAGLMISR